MYSSGTPNFRNTQQAVNGSILGMFQEKDVIAHAGGNS
jgi:hypothetical protein